VPIRARVLATAVLVLVAACAAPASTPTPLATPAATCASGLQSPPAATLLDAAGNDVEGAFGSFDYCGLHGERPSPGLSLEVVPLAADEINVVISVPAGPPFVAWQVVSATGPEAPATATLSQGINEGGGESVSFAGPPTGDWTIVAQLTYPGVTGQVTYYWRVAAP
jgi:hypothetical protein